MITITAAPQPMSVNSSRTSGMTHMNDTSPPETVASFAKSRST